MDANMERIVRQEFDSLRSVLDEQTRRLWAGAEAKALGYGGVSLVAKATGLWRTTIHQGMKDLSGGSVKADRVLKRIRSPGGGRKSIVHYDASVRRDLERLVDPVTRGDLESPLRWTCKSVRQLSVALQNQGHVIGRQKVADLLADMGYSLQANQKTREGSGDPDRDKQFAF